MADENTNTTTATTESTKKEKFVPVFQWNVTRNEVEMPVVQDVKSRGEDKGASYLRFDDFKPENLDNVIKFLTPKTVCDILNGKMAVVGSTITENATGEDGLLNVEQARTYFADFSTRGESKADLQERKDGLVAEMLTVTTNPVFDTMEKKMAEMTRIAGEINNLTIAIESKVRAPRKSKEEKEKEAAAAGAGVPANA